MQVRTQRLKRKRRCTKPSFEPRVSIQELSAFRDMTRNIYMPGWHTRSLLQIVGVVLPCFASCACTSCLFASNFPLDSQRCCPPDTWLKLWWRIKSKWESNHKWKIHKICKMCSWIDVQNVSHFRRGNPAGKNFSPGESQNQDFCLQDWHLIPTPALRSASTPLHPNCSQRCEQEFSTSRPPSQFPRTWH